MKIKKILFLSLIAISCSHETDSEAENSADKSVEEQKEEIVVPPLNITVGEKVFELGSNTHFTDSCSFVFECDCCAGKLIFNSDSTFYYLDYCMSDQVARKGLYRIIDQTLRLDYGPEIVSRLYNYENEIDTTAIDFVMKDTLASHLTINYSVSMCNDLVLLADLENSFIAIESSSSYNELLSYLRKEEFLKRLDDADSKTTPEHDKALEFINEYLHYSNDLNSKSSLTEWINMRDDVTEEFKNELFRIIEEANDYEHGLGYDPILNAQDSPDEFIIDRQESEFLIVKGKDWPEFQVVLKLKFIEDTWFVDGCGIVNIPLDKRI